MLLGFARSSVGGTSTGHRGHKCSVDCELRPQSASPFAMTSMRRSSCRATSTLRSRSRTLRATVFPNHLLSCFSKTTLNGNWSLPSTSPTSRMLHTSPARSFTSLKDKRVSVRIILHTHHFPSAAKKWDQTVKTAGGPRQFWTTCWIAAQSMSNLEID